jgi:hypothetical protein
MVLGDRRDRGIAMFQRLDIEGPIRASRNQRPEERREAECRSP